MAIQFSRPESLGLLFIGANIQAKVNVKQHPNTEALKASINKVWANMFGNKSRIICSRFRPRVWEVIVAKGGYID